MRTILFTLVALWLTGISRAGEKPKIVFISGTPSHGPMAHEHRAGNTLLAKALDAAGLGVQTIVLPENGYPIDSSVLKDTATIVVFCSGEQAHLLNPKLEEFDAIMKRGTGLVMIHWATEAAIGMPGKKFLEWIGGFCALNWSVNPRWSPQFSSFPDHPISRGLTPFSIDDEWYYHMRFVPEMTGVTPILSAVPGAGTLKRPDGPRSGNPDVRRAVANGEKQHVAWAYERPDGKGRGFGFTGAHNHINWQNDNFRKVVLNAILWTAHVEIPPKGVPSKTPTSEEIKANLDDKTPKQKNPPEPVIIPALEEARRKSLSQMDHSVALEMLSRTISGTKNTSIRNSLMKGMLLGLEGQRNVTPPPSWETLLQSLDTNSDNETRSLTQKLSQIFGDESATQSAISILKDRSAKTSDRLQALSSLLTQRRKELLPILETLLDEEPLRISAIRGYGTIESPTAGNLLLSRYPTFPPAAQRAVIETLATRKIYAESLLNALDTKSIPPDAIPAYVSRSLSSLLGEKFDQSYGVKALVKDKEVLFSKYGKLATSAALEKASANSGRAVFQRVCMACHQMYGEGGIVGPDLTGSNRGDLNYLLLNILDPSGDIPNAYKMVVITTKNGQVLAGSVIEENDQKVVLSMIGQKNTIIKDDIKSRELSPFSMMPEGLLQTLKDQEILDLIKYFQTKAQVELPK